MRAILVALMVATPSLLLPGMAQEVTQMVALFAIFAAIFVFVEYAAVYPGLIEFRDAPPFNRVRFLMIFFTVFLISVAVRGGYDPTTLTRFVEAVGILLGHSVDFRYSPMSLMMALLPKGTTLEQANSVRMAGGLAYLVALVSLTIFAILIRLRSWPSPNGTFNVWINLPTFDPTAGSDVVKRLNRDARINILLGFVLIYVAPPLTALVAGHYNLSIFTNDQTLIWTMTLWAFMPASLFMRGIAMRRLSDMIAAKRRRLVATLQQDAVVFRPV
jgi:hypothetical protein